MRANERRYESLAKSGWEAFWAVIIVIITCYSVGKFDNCSMRHRLCSFWLRCDGMDGLGHSSDCPIFFFNRGCNVRKINDYLPHFDPDWDETELQYLLRSIKW